MTGYAVDPPGTNYLTPEHWPAYRSAQRLRQLRTERPELGLGPDGKVLVLLEAENASSRLAGFSTSLHHAPDADPIRLHRAILELLRSELAETTQAIPGFDPEIPDAVNVNGAGNFVVGGPEGDNGLSGKKLVIDAYGPRVAIGGGSLGQGLLQGRSGRGYYRPAVGQSGGDDWGCPRVPGDVGLLTGGRRGEDHLTPRRRWATTGCSTMESPLGSFPGGNWWVYALTTALAEIARWGHFSAPDRPWE